MKPSTQKAAASRSRSGDQREAADEKRRGRERRHAGSKSSPTRPKRDIDVRAAEALQFAKELVEKGIDWITIGNALFGVGGKLTQLFPDIRERATLAGSRPYKELCALLDQERDEEGDPRGELAEKLSTASGQTIVRMPRSMHAALLAEAEAEGVSLNQLCVSKLAMQLRGVVRMA